MEGRQINNGKNVREKACKWLKEIGRLVSLSVSHPYVACVCVYVCLSVYISIYLSIYLSICLHLSYDFTIAHKKSLRLHVHGHIHLYPIDRSHHILKYVREYRIYASVQCHVASSILSLSKMAGDQTQLIHVQ